jgi:gliding-associated putative ABC transporter substrate-binding component GldG
MKKQNLITNIVVFIAIIVMINLVSVSVFKRLDFSKGHVYSLTKASKEAVRGLEDNLVVKAYFSKNLPGQLADARRYTEDMLSEYQAYSKGKLRFEFIDPKDEEGMKEEARKNQIQPMQVQSVEKDEMAIREIYMGLAFLYQDKVESIPAVQNTAGIEYDFTKIIKKVTSKGMKKIAFFPKEVELPPQMQQQMMQNPNDNFTQIRQMLADSYELSTTDLAEELTSDISTLVFSGTQDSLSDEQLFNLDQYIVKGGNVLFFQEKVTADLQQQSATLINSNLFSMLSSYGINIKDNLVTDALCGQIQVQRQQGMFRFNTPISYPLFPVINNVNKDNIIVKNLDVLQFLFASEIDVTRINDNISFEPLLYSSENSGQINPPQFDISIQQFMDKNIKQMLIDSPKVLSGLYKGIFPSYFANNPMFANVVPSGMEGKILLVADSDFIKNSGAAGVKGNLDFVLNSVDYLASESALIEIRSRETEFIPLKDLKPGQKNLIKWLNILFPSILLVLIGVVNWRKELNKRKLIGEMYE